MSRRWTPKELMYDLVGLQSDSFTERETAMGRHIYALICEQDYWRLNPDLCGLYDGKDVIGRRIPWALRRGNTDRTIILSGHMDAVEIDSYGELKSFALTPDRLRKNLLKRGYTGDVKKDLEDENWCFGRGTADMKGGMACILCELFRHAEENLCMGVNILFVGVHDEEHQAMGIMQSVGLLNDLKNQYGLDYKLLINPEPALRSDPNKYVYVDGSIGKMLTGIVVKGEVAHVVNVMSGPSSTMIAANIVRKVELNPKLCCEEFGQITPPPAILYMKDAKREYNVSIPGYTEIYLHVPLTKNRSAPQVLEEIKELCMEAARETINYFHETYIAIYGSEEGSPDPQIGTHTYAELDEICRKVAPDYEKRKSDLLDEKTKLVKSGLSLVQTGAGFEIMERMIEMSKIINPVIIIGLLPPYVPPVNNHYLQGFDRAAIIDAVAEMLDKRFGLGLEVVPYTMGMSDNSYISCVEVEQDMIAMKSMVTPRELYDIPFEAIERIAMPSILCGPWGKDFHTATERVYLPDIEERTPAVIETIIRNIVLM